MKSETPRFALPLLIVLTAALVTLSLTACTGDDAGDGDGVCEPDCEQLGQAFECGDDGCGGSCGTCTAGEVCGGTFGVECVAPPVCVPNCEQLGQAFECGDDGCGGSCGTSTGGEVCGGTFGVECVAPPVCVPNCEQLGQAFECGDDGCGGSCGTCPDGEVCGGLLNVECVAPPACTPQCGTLIGMDRECGDDGCGGTCGECDAPEACWGFGFDEDNGWECRCMPDCEGKQCGDDGCGGTCGACADGPDACDVGSGQCACTPNCMTPFGAPVACGSDGCGGLCPDTCNSIDTCFADQQQCVCTATIPIAERLPVKTNLRTRKNTIDVISPNASYLYARSDVASPIELGGGSALMVTDSTPDTYSSSACEMVSPPNAVCTDMVITAYGSVTPFGTGAVFMSAANTAACLTYFENIWASGFTIECPGNGLAVNVSSGAGAGCEETLTPTTLEIEYSCDDIGAPTTPGVCGD